MTHISSYTADSLYLGIFIRAPPRHHTELPELHPSPQPSCIHLDRVNLHLAVHYVQRSHKLPGSHWALQSDNYKQGFYFFSRLYLFISALSFKPFITTDDSLSFMWIV